MQKHKNTIMLVVAFVLVAGISFYGGTQYAQSNPSSGQAQFGANGGFRGGMMGGRGGSRNSAGFATGQVISKDDQSITLKLMNGSKVSEIDIQGTSCSQKPDIYSTLILDTFWEITK